MTSKERAALRAQANGLDAIFQVGKGGLNDAFYKQVDEALTTRELIKVRVLLESSPVKPKDAAAEIASATGADVIGVVGGVIILYRYSKELHDKQAKKAANIKKAKSQVLKNSQKRGSKYAKNRNIRGDF